MGDPRKAKKKYTRPRSIWTSDQISSELYVVGSYGLRNKKELWKAQTEIARIRNQARALLALPTETRHEKETNLLHFLSRLGLVTTSSTLDDILNLKIEARQMVVHGHVSIGNRKVNLPGYLVKKEEELEILVHLNPVMEAGNANA